MEQMEKKKLTIAICKELEDGSVSHSNTSQGHALQEEEEESDTPQELPSPHTGSVSGGSARALAHALREEEEEEGDTPQELPSPRSVSGGSARALAFVLREEEEGTDVSSQGTVPVEKQELTTNDESDDEAGSDEFLHVGPAMAFLEEL